mgnify:CR=1 FL=1
MDVEKLLKKCKELGFTVTEADKKYVCISQYSPEGQDCNVSVETENLIENLRTYAECFDVSEETYYWLDSFGHGSNGAPYDMKDVYEDMQWWKETLLVLVDELEAYQQSEKWIVISVTNNDIDDPNYFDSYEDAYDWMRMEYDHLIDDGNTAHIHKFYASIQTGCNSFAWRIISASEEMDD